jgi:hypothetical protein
MNVFIKRTALIKTIELFAVDQSALSMSPTGRASGDGEPDALGVF